jgi:hypothetical protein
MATVGQGSEGVGPDSQLAERFTDLTEGSTGTITTPSTHEHTSDALYIVREANYLFELSEALEKVGVELKEGSDESEVRQVESEGASD